MGAKLPVTVRSSSMELEYIIADPTGNITLLITTPVPERERARYAGHLMEHEPAAEQAGFLRLTEAGVSLDMAGGEFCGNASLSAAAAYAWEKGLRPGERLAVSVRVSGTPKPVTAVIEALGGGSFYGTVDMPPPVSARTQSFTLDGREYFLPLVSFEGISHVIAPGDLPGERAEAAARRWCAELDAPALGLMLLDEAQMRLRPLVYVPGADTMFWESSCASGTTAVGAWLSLRDGAPRSLNLKAPGGVLSIEADFAGGVFRLGGHVRLGQRKRAEGVEIQRK